MSVNYIQLSVSTLYVTQNLHHVELNNRKQELTIYKLAVKTM